MSTQSTHVSYTMIRYLPKAPLLSYIKDYDICLKKMDSTNYYEYLSW